jgi:hypothetical protein
MQQDKNNEAKVFGKKVYFSFVIKKNVIYLLQITYPSNSFS